MSRLTFTYTAEEGEDGLLHLETRIERDGQLLEAHARTVRDNLDGTRGFMRNLGGMVQTRIHTLYGAPEGITVSADQVRSAADKAGLTFFTGGELK